MMLKPDTPESRLLVDWVEGGEFRALCPSAASIPVAIAAQLQTHNIVAAVLQSTTRLVDAQQKLVYVDILQQTHCRCL